MLPTETPNGHSLNGMAMANPISHRDKIRKMGRRSLSDDAPPAQNAAIRPCTDFDVAYFQSYSHLGIHEEMIKDRVRTDAYRNAIFHHKDFIAGKVVVDVGCGTGILSIFCAQAGAKRVYAIDASDIAVQANEVIKANNLSDTVKVLHGRVEDVEIDEGVDVIVSEWMGYMLLYESMLGSVITARDRWLKPGGLILPSIATLYMAPVSHPDRYNESIDFWRNVYGIDSSPPMNVVIKLKREQSKRKKDTQIYVVHQIWLRPQEREIRLYGGGNTVSVQLVMRG